MWTQEEAIAFECAREAISQMMAIQTHLIADETHKGEPDQTKIAALRTERSRLARERTGLHVDNQGEVARIRTEYGAALRAWRTAHHESAA